MSPKPKNRPSHNLEARDNFEDVRHPPVPMWTKVKCILHPQKRFPWSKKVELEANTPVLARGQIAPEFKEKERARMEVTTADRNIGWVYLDELTDKNPATPLPVV